MFQERKKSQRWEVNLSLASLDPNRRLVCFFVLFWFFVCFSTDAITQNSDVSNI